MTKRYSVDTTTKRVYLNIPLADFNEMPKDMFLWLSNRNRKARGRLRAQHDPLHDGQPPNKSYLDLLRRLRDVLCGEDSASGEDAPDVSHEDDPPPAYKSLCDSRSNERTWPASLAEANLNFRVACRPATAQVFDEGLNLILHGLVKHISWFQSPEGLLASRNHYAIIDCITKEDHGVERVIATTSTASEMIHGDLYFYCTKQMRAASFAQLHEDFLKSRPEERLRPCQHSLSYERRPSDVMFTCHRNEKLGHEAPLKIGRRGDCRNQWNSQTVVSCQYCYTDYDIHLGFGFLPSHDVSIEEEKERKPYYLEARTWHNVGSGRNALSDKWVRIRNLTPNSRSAQVLETRARKLDRLKGSVMQEYTNYMVRFTDI